MPVLRKSALSSDSVVPSDVRSNSWLGAQQRWRLSGLAADWKVVNDTGKALTSRLGKEYCELQKVIVESWKVVVVAKGCSGLKNIKIEFLYFFVNSSKILPLFFNFIFEKLTSKWRFSGFFLNLRVRPVFVDLRTNFNVFASEFGNFGAGFSTSFFVCLSKNHFNLLLKETLQCYN